MSRDNLFSAQLPKQNNFELLRLILATAVVFEHIYWLTRIPEFEFLTQAIPERFAVEAFFIVSAFLASASYLNSQSVWQFMSKRLRRILPAYITVVTLCFIAGILLTTLPLEEFFTSGGLAYLGWNFAFLNFVQPDLPGVFATLPKQDINGSLWTLKIELAFYLVIPAIFYLFRRFDAMSISLIIYGLSFVYLSVFEGMARDGIQLAQQLSHQLPGQMAFFITGMLLLVNRDWLVTYGWQLLLLALCGGLLSLAGITAVLLPASMAIGLLMFAIRLPYLGNFGKYGDFSYGIYLWHWPAIQGFLLADLFERLGHWQAFGLLLIVVYLLAWASWHLVEKTFLLGSSHYRLSAESVGTRASANTPDAAHKS
jgi:peptidoglycan/LPS O-acetylase OafA/YrhL